MDRIVVYGIKNCNTVKKAVDWLANNQLDYVFHDYKKAGIKEEKIQEWQGQVSWENLLNKRGTTWRKLASSRQEEVIDAKSANVLMQEHTSLIKRPIIESGNDLLIGFNEEEYQQKLIK